MKKSTIVCLIALVVLFQACGGAKIPSSPCGSPEKRGKFRASNPAQMQVQLVQVTKAYRNRADLTCITKRGDSVYLHYGWSPGNRPYHLLKPGLRLTIEYDSVPCEPGTWIAANIRINK